MRFSPREVWNLRDRPSIVALLRRPEIHLEDLMKEGVLDSENLRARGSCFD